MGKLKKPRRNQKRRTNPIARKGAPEKKGEPALAKRVSPLIEKLGSNVQNDKFLALNAITVLIENPEMRKLFLKERLVSTIMDKTINDANDELVVESLGLLRNLVIEEGHEVAKYLWRLNIWAVVEKSLDNMIKSFDYLSKNDKMEKKRVHLLFDLVENVLSLVTSMASSSEEMDSLVFSRIDPVLQVVTGLVQLNLPELRCSVRMFNSLLDFVYEFASDSAEFVLKLELFPIQEIRAALANGGSNALGRVYAEGIAFHMGEVVGVENREQFAVEILGRVLEALKLDLLRVHEDLKPKEESQEEKKDIDMVIGDSPEQVQAKLDIQALDVAMDIFATVCEYLAVSETNFSSLLDTLAQVHALLVEIWRLDTERVFELNHKILIALNNMCWLFLAAECDAEFWVDGLPGLWEMAEQMLQQDNLELQRLCLNVFWGILQSAESFSARVTPEMVAGLIQKSRAVAETLDKSDNAVLDTDFLVSAVGFLGCVAKLSPVEVVLQIGAFLMQQIGAFAQAPYPEGINVALEGLNAIYDVFGDANYSYDGPVFVEQGYLAQLQQMEPHVKKGCKSIDRKTHAELRDKADGTWLTLRRFIEYKQREYPARA